LKEADVMRLLSLAWSRHRRERTNFPPVPFARYTDANREFADSRDGIKYLLIALAFFGMLYVCGKALGTI